MEEPGMMITVTFIILIASTQIFILLFSPYPHGVPTVIEGSITILGVRVVLQRLALIPLSISALLLLHIFLRKTRPGKVIRALAQDETAVRLLGIDAERYKLVVVMISSMLASIAGAFYLSLEVVTPTTVLAPLGPIFTATILGGLGSLPGAIVAGMLLGYSETAAIYLFGSHLKGIIPLIAAILALQIRPYGLLGRK